ncbi:MAG: HD domain-containing protein [Candidatus Izemoplasmatales bacterium]|nr:HD domain-containing protein [Candidatus Izemoplasmatales bacterium]
MFENGVKYDFFAKVVQINDSTYDTFPVTVLTENNESAIVRVKQGESLSLNKIYYFKTLGILFKEKIHLEVIEFKKLSDFDLSDAKREKLMKFFYNHAPVNTIEIMNDIEDVIKNLENQVIKDMTTKIYFDKKDDFYLYPAATKFHHAYISGLAYHTHSMLKLAKGFLAVYEWLNADLVYAGIILHDICKISEFDSYEGSSYTVKGKLIGHIAMGVSLLDQVANELGYKDEEEVMLLQHIMLSHHYYGNFGSPKKPNIAEALMIHFIDNIDSKACVLGEELELVEIGDLTGPIGVLDRERYYKHKLSK